MGFLVVNSLLAVTYPIARTVTLMSLGLKHRALSACGGSVEGLNPDYKTSTPNHTATLPPPPPPPAAAAAAAPPPPLYQNTKQNLSQHVVNLLNDFLIILYCGIFFFCIFLIHIFFNRVSLQLHQIYAK